jgi:hypothetical protein
LNSPTFRRLFLLITLLVFCSVIAVGIYTQTSKSQKKSKDHPRTYEAAKVTDLPAVISGIKGLEITSVSLINQGTPEAALNIDVTNKRNEDVMALDFIAGKNTYSGLRMDGLLEEGNARVVIPRHSLKTFTWSLGSILEGQTISLAAAVFSDGKEEGERWALEGIKKSRIKFQEKQRAEKAKNQK